jgi:hypothetical protein
MRYLRAVPWALLIVFAISGAANLVEARDAAVYHAVDWPPSYEGSTALISSYNYSPAFAFWVQPLQTMDFSAFRLLITLANMAALAYLVGPWGALLLVGLQMPLVAQDLAVGNINLIVGALVVLALRYPALYAFPVLTKVTPAVGVVWHAARGEWRSVAIAGAVTLAIALPSLVLSPTSWVEWVQLLTANDRLVSDLLVVPVWMRATVAIGLTFYAARTDRIWLVPIAAALVGPHNGATWLIALGAVRLANPVQPRRRAGIPGRGGGGFDDAHGVDR